MSILSLDSKPASFSLNGVVLLWLQRPLLAMGLVTRKLTGMQKEAHGFPVQQFKTGPSQYQTVAFTDRSGLSGLYNLGPTDIHEVFTPSLYPVSLHPADILCSAHSILPNPRCTHQLRDLEFWSNRLADSKVQNMERHFDHPESLDRKQWLPHRVSSSKSVLRHPINPIFSPSRIA